MLICFAWDAALPLKAAIELCLPCAERAPGHPATCSDLRPLLRSSRARTQRSLLQQAPPRLQAALQPAAGLVRRSHALLLVLLIAAAWLYAAEWLNGVH